MYELCIQNPNDPACKKERVEQAREKYYSAKYKKSKVDALNEMID